MYCLFISTFDKIITIGLLKNGDVLDKLEKNSSKNHSEFVMPMIKSILDNNNIDTSFLNEIIVVNGPGSFTGVRIGVTIAKTLAYTLNIPIKTITSLKAYAVSSNNSNEKIVVISDLKGKYIGYFDQNNELLSDYFYLKNDLYEEYINDKKDLIISNNELNLSNIYLYLKNTESIIPHLVNPIYVKGIDALNDK